MSAKPGCPLDLGAGFVSLKSEASAKAGEVPQTGHSANLGVPQIPGGSHKPSGCREQHLYPLFPPSCLPVALGVPPETGCDSPPFPPSSAHPQTPSA